MTNTPTSLRLGTCCCVACWSSISFCSSLSFSKYPLPLPAIVDWHNNDQLNACPRYPLFPTLHHGLRITQTFTGLLLSMPFACCPNSKCEITVNSLIATTSRKRPPPVSDHFVNNRFVSQSSTVSKTVS